MHRCDCDVLPSFIALASISKDNIKFLFWFKTVFLILRFWKYVYCCSSSDFWNHKSVCILWYFLNKVIVYVLFTVYVNIQGVLMCMYSYKFTQIFANIQIGGGGGVVGSRLYPKITLGAPLHSSWNPSLRGNSFRSKHGIQ